MPQDLSRFHKLDDPAIRAELGAIRASLADCLERMDRLELVDVAQHLDLALVRFDERYPVGAFDREAREAEAGRGSKHG